MMDRGRVLSGCFRWFIVCKLLLLLLLTFKTVDGASFYGASYVRLPLEDAKSTTEIQFRFKTHRPDAFLFLAAGTTDYCLVVIEAGGLKVRINLGAGESELVTPQGLRLDDLAWHTVDLKRVDAALTLTVDSIPQARLTIPGRFYELNIHYGVFVGSMGDFRELFLGIIEPYRGCLDDLIYNGVDVFKTARESITSAAMSASSSSQQPPAHMVTWDCSAEFDATEEKPFSLVADGAFVAFPTLVARNGASFSCDIKTQSNGSVLLYNTGIPSDSDFVAVEIVPGGRVRLAVDHGNSVAELLSEASVNDGLWHRLEVRFGSTSMEIAVDEQVVTLRPHLGDQRHLDLKGPMYVGGIELNRKARAVAQGVLSVQSAAGAGGAEVGAFRGCLWNLRVNDAAVGLRQALVTHGVRSDCIWDYPCLRQPCVAEARCVQDGLEGFRCLCDPTVAAAASVAATSCVKPDYNSAYKVFTSSQAGGQAASGVEEEQLEMLELHPLHIKEGATELITSNHIDVALELNLYEIRQSGVIFHVVQQPQHGKIEVDVWRRHGAGNLFTLLDLNSDKVRYTHDGSEQHADSVLLELEFLQARRRDGTEELPDFLGRRHRFVFHVVVTPVNDPPEIRAAPGRVLRLAQNTRRLITPDILSADDPDNDHKDLVFTVLQGEGGGGAGSGEGAGGGHLENSRNPGKAAETFTQEDIDGGLISYVHRGAANARIAVKVSDGIETAPTVVLRVAAFQLEIHMVNNTGLQVAYHSHTLITAENLTFSTNAPELNHDVRYDVTRLPHFGHIQLQRHGNHWQNVNHFTQLHILKEKVRYQHTASAGTAVGHHQRRHHDDFKFTVSCNGISVATVYDFRVTFVRNRIAIANNAELLLDKVLEQSVGPEHLRAETVPHAVEDELIVYVVQSGPSYGTLWLEPVGAALATVVPPSATAGNPHRHGHGGGSRGGGGGGVGAARPLSAGANFTQADVNAGRLRYRLRHKSYSVIRDSFDLRAHLASSSSSSSASGDVDGVTSGLFTFRVHHVPPAELINGNGGEGAASAVLGLLEVGEGERTTITASTLDLRIPKVDGILFRVIEKPRHGRVELTSSASGGGNTGSVGGHSILNFTSHDVQGGKLSYVHDDTEHDRDTVGLLATALDEGANEFQFVGTLTVRVLMKNDMQPERAVDRVLHVVNGGERRLSARDLLFVDADLGTTPADLQYTRRGIPNGAIFHVDSPDTQVFKFTQKDINNGKILFRHHGASYGRAALWITDGKFFVNGILEVRASDPFLTIINNTGAVVKRGHWTALSGSNLSIDTNLNIRSDQVRYLVAVPPAHGSVVLLPSPANDTAPAIDRQPIKAITEFTQDDVYAGRVAYRSDGSASFGDNFSFEVHAAETRTDGNFELRVFPESYWEPMEVAGNRTVAVEEGQRVTIDPVYLSVSHQNVDPREITYVVKRAPQHGYIATDVSLDLSSLAAPNSVTGHPGGGNGGANGGALATYTTVFDQATINERRVKYVHTERNATEDYVLFDVSNGVQVLADLRLTFEIIPTDIVLRTSELTVDEGHQVALSDVTIAVANRHFQGKIKEYAMVKPPKHGKLMFAGANGEPSGRGSIDRCTPAQLRAQHVVYLHDGSETAVDEFVVVGRTKEGDRESLPATVRVRVRPVNDEAPVVRRNVKLEVWQGSATVITPEYLKSTDNDTTDEDLMFTLKTSPTNGYLAFSNKTKEKILNFTQSMINNGKVAFVHSGDAIGSFLFSVSDGPHTSDSHIFSVQAKPIALHVQHNTKLYVFPSLQQTISVRHLLAVTSDFDGKRAITYGIKHSGPRLGKLVRLSEDGSSAREVTSFTQDQVNRSLIAYKHTEQFAELVATDQFTFDIKSSNAEALKDLVFNIEISVVTINPDGLEQYLLTSPVVVDEGGRATVTHKHLNSSRLSEVLGENRNARFQPRLFMVVREPPAHGAIVIRHANATNETQFDQKDVNAGSVIYMHDHSDTFRDNAVIGINLDNSVAGGATVLLLNATLRFEVRPINDRPFELMTTAPRIEVVQGQMVRIGSEHLKTTDADTSPDDLRYDIISGPTDGQVVLKPSPATASTRLVTNFTQRDIDDGRLWYIHNGTLDTASFHFKVSDGAFKPVYTIFNIHVVQLTLELTNNTPIVVPQGSSSVYLKSVNLGAATNGNRSHIWYNLTSTPQHGHLFLNDAVVHQFSQNDLDHEKVLYVQMNMSSSSDSFVATVWNEDRHLDGQQLQVLVRPLLVPKPNAEVTAGTRFVISLDVLDATKLAEKTKSNPVFTIIRRPKFGKLRMLNARRRPNSNHHQQQIRKRDSPSLLSSPPDDVLHFTHEDIVNGAVVYETRDFKILSPVNDSFDFVLSAFGVQPAVGSLVMHVQPKGAAGAGSTPAITPVAQIPATDQDRSWPSGATVSSTAHPPPFLGGPSMGRIPVDGDDGTGFGVAEEDDEKAPALHPSLTNDHLLIIALAVGVVVLTVLIIVAVRCAIQKRSKKPPKCSAVRSSATTNGGPLPPPPSLDMDTRYHCVPTSDQSSDMAGNGGMHYDEEMEDDMAGGGSIGRGMTPPMSMRSRPTSPRLRMHSHTSSSLHSQTEPSSSLRATPCAIPEEDWGSELSSAVPTCKVTPLSQNDGNDVNETTLKYPYSFVEPGPVDSWSMSYDPCNELPYNNRPSNPMLRKNQYWV